jgi:hypothetical protein
MHPLPSSISTALWHDAHSPSFSGYLPSEAFFGEGIMGRSFSMLSSSPMINLEKMVVNGFFQCLKSEFGIKSVVID